MYGLKATHPQYPQIVQWPGEVAAKSLGKDGLAQKAQLKKPIKLMPGEEQHRRVQAGPNKLTPGKV